MRLARLLLLCSVCAISEPLFAQLAVRGKWIHTVNGAPIEAGVVLIERGKIKAVGPASRVAIPKGWRVLDAAVVTPGLIDARSTLGLTGILNAKDQAHDQEQLENSAPMQPELRAVDAYNPLDPLIAWTRSFGVTTVHTGHAPGELVSGGTAIFKLRGSTAEQALVRADAAIVAQLGPGSTKSDKAPGTRAKQLALLRAELIKAKEYQEKATKPEAKEPPARDLRQETWGRVLSRETPLIITAHRAQDIASALRLADEFGLRFWIDGASEAYLLIDELRQHQAPVIARPSMMRAVGDQENATFELPRLLREAGINTTMGTGFEGYVPKVRVLLFEAALSAAHGLPTSEALKMVTLDTARLLGLEARLGSIEVGKDADLALYDGDPFEYTTHCLATIIDGVVEFEGKR
jgi:imidazolonepropionase-like amidohydrolase